MPNLYGKHHLVTPTGPYGRTDSQGVRTSHAARIIQNLFNSTGVYYIGPTHTMTRLIRVIHQHQNSNLSPLEFHRFQHFGRPQHSYPDNQWMQKERTTATTGNTILLKSSR